MASKFSFWTCKTTMRRQVLTEKRNTLFWAISKRIKEDNRHFRFCIVSNISNLKFINIEHGYNIQSIAEQA
ncbi:hypothetical protein SUGI_0122140 [Cryptomeria japonica]|nr:hypothetical protein SUGI_0122140 [Cryptomeria japonica]